MSPCAICSEISDPSKPQRLVIVVSERWIVRHHLLPAPLVGWCQLVSRRHVQGPASLDDEEAAEFGPALREVSRVIERWRGVLRVYAIAFGEGAPHLHAHLVPRYESRPETAAWGIADVYRDVAADRLPAAEPSEVARAIEELRRELLAAPSRRWRTPA
jgi:diadenosine tetraphosphate (Ap4A) HIT family hydrolase